jgi:hypothetical protein
VDEAIAHTSSLIAKLKQMKAGLLHDLLTGKVRVKDGKEWKIDQLETSKLKNA